MCLTGYFVCWENWVILSTAPLHFLQCVSVVPKWGNSVPPPQGHLAIAGDIFDCHNYVCVGAPCIWGRSQEY